MINSFILRKKILLLIYAYLQIVTFLLNYASKWDFVFIDMLICNAFR